MQAETPRLDSFQALVFDVYGTLMDWELGIYAALRPLLDRASKASSWSRQEALVAFFSVERDLQVQNPTLPCNELLAVAYKAFATRLETESTPTEDSAFGQSISNWPVFPDTVAALAMLKKHYKLVVLSNIDNNSFHNYTRPVLEPNGVGSIFDLVLTAQDVGAYKPDPLMFETALAAIKKEFGVERDKVLCTAQSLTHDHEPANALGLHSCFINRDGAVTGIGSHAKYDFTFKTLGEMAESRDKGGNS